MLYPERKKDNFFTFSNLRGKVETKELWERIFKSTPFKDGYNISFRFLFQNSELGLKRSIVFICGEDSRSERKYSIYKRKLNLREKKNENDVINLT